MRAHQRGFQVWSDGVVELPDGRRVRCALGRKGVTQAELKREGDGCTPAGVWRLGNVYWRHHRLDPPDTDLPRIAIRERFGWCDDPADPLYNQQVTLPYPASAEHMWREDELYDVCVVLDYNRNPVIAGRGSAIFLHVARPDYSPTEGCVALALNDLLDLLRACTTDDALEIHATPSPA